MVRQVSPTVLVAFCVLFQVIPQIATAYKASNVLAHYVLNGSDSNTSNVGASYLSGRYPGSKAAFFKSPDTHVATPSIDLGQGNFTIACWIMLYYSNRSQNQIIYSDWIQGRLGFYFSVLRNTNRLRFRRSKTDRNFTTVDGPTVPSNRWVHVAVTWKQSEGVGLVYVDAKDFGKNTSFGKYDEYNGPSGSQNWIGNDRKYGRQFYGAIMDLYVLDVALSPEELNQLRGFPKITSPIPAAVTLYENEALKCKAEGLPSPHVTWLHNGHIVDNGTSLAILKISKLGEEHGGSYKCAASNMVGETSKVVNITVVGPFALCTEYFTIDDVTRSVDHPFKGSVIAETVDNQKWYRLSGRAGTQLPTRCVPVNRCGAQAPGWLNGKYPDVKDGIVQRKVCFHLNGDCCGYENTVQTRKCFEGFYVYKFESLPSSIPGRYCATVYKEKEEYISSPIYVSTLDTVGFALKGHVMYTVNYVPDPTLCMSYCNLLEKSCDSFNFSPQHQVCELNNVTKETHDADYKQDEAFIYYEKAGQSVKAGEAWCGQ